MNYQYSILTKLEMDLKEINLKMYFIVLNTNTESVSSEYTPDTKESNFTFHNKCPVCPYRQKDQQGHPMFQPATQDSSLIELNYRLMILYN